MKKIIFYVIIMLVETIMALSIQAQNKQAQILVGPNIQVSQDGNYPHVECMFAANPIDSNNLLGAAGTLTGTAAYGGTKVYFSKDGGKSWKNRSFVEQLKFGGGDPEVAFGLNGTAYLVTICFDANYQLSFYRSEDGGETWDKPINLGKTLYGLPGAFDHEQIVVDQTFGKFAGRIYVSGLAADEKGIGDKSFRSNHALWLFRSDDDGKSFIGPIRVIGEEESMGANGTNLLISSKGTLFFTYNEWCNNRSMPGYFEGYQPKVIVSKDGGISFSKPYSITRYKVDNNDFMAMHCQYAIDNKSEKYKDRLYFVYNDSQNGRSRIMITYSKDEGKTWSKPKAIDSNLPENTHQYLPAVAVNHRGVVGIRWYDTRGTEIKKGFNEYFTASLDGGDTFLKAVKVSSELSKVPVVDSSSYLIPLYDRYPSPDSLQISFHWNCVPYFFYDRWPQGGDYIQFTTDAKGVFHDFWTDSREDNTYQIYTSAIKVVEPGSKDEIIDIETEKLTHSKIDSSENGEKKLQLINSYIGLQFGSVSYDTITNIISIPVKLKNTSNKVLYGPINVEISRIDEIKEFQKLTVIMNADNHISGAGATFNYALDGSKGLRPKEETNTLIWQLKADIPIEMTSSSRYDSIPDFHVKVMGYVGY